MSTSIKDLLVKINKIEREINAVNTETKKLGTNKCYSLKKNLLNYSCIEKTKIEFSSITFYAGDDNLIETEVEFISSSNQYIEISIVMSDLVIAKLKKKAEIGNNIFSLNSLFVPKVNDTTDIYVYITPLDEKQIVLSGCQINIFGATFNENIKKYQVIDLGEKLLVSQLIENSIYYKIITKEETMLEQSDFEFLSYAKDYSFVSVGENKSLYLLKVDDNNNLVFENFETGSYEIVEEKVEKISADSIDELVIFAYIKNEKCYVGEIENGSYDRPKICYNFKTKNCNVFYDKFKKKMCLNLELPNGKNLLFFENDSIKTEGEKINFNFDIFVNTYEVENAS